MTAPSTFILVHGAWHGAWCYRRVESRLTALGHRVFATTLTGLAERSHLLSASITLQTHVDDVTNLARWEGLDGIVLVGHSYGGMVITGAAEALGARVRSLVYLDAFVPRANESMLQIAGPELAARLGAAKTPDDTILPISAKAFGVNEADAAWVDAQCTPHPYRTFQGALASVDALDRVARKTHVRAVGSASVSLDRAAARCNGRPGWTSIDIACGHDLMIDDPAGSVEILLGAAA